MILERFWFYNSQETDELAKVIQVERAISKSNGNRRISKIMLINPDNKHSLFQSIATIK